MKIFCSIFIYIIFTTLVSCGELVKFDVVSTSDVPPTPVATNPCTQVAGSEIPCIVLVENSATIGKYKMTDKTRAQNNTAIHYQPITNDVGRTVQSTGTIAGGSQVLYGTDPINRPSKLINEIIGVNSSGVLTSSIAQLGTLNFNGSYAQVGYSLSGEVISNNTGTTRLIINGDAGTLTLTGSGNFAINNSVLNYNDENNVFYSLNSLALLFDESEIVGIYKIEKDTTYYTGTYGGVKIN